MYKFKPSLWAENQKKLYLYKMINSSNTPDDEYKEYLIKEYEKRFEMGDMIRESFEKNLWGKNPAKKKTFKIMLNSGWGKHAQRPIMPQSIVIDFSTNSEKAVEAFKNMCEGNTEFRSLHIIGERTLYTVLNNGEEVKPQFHKTYLPAALFVPAYGRLQLWEQLNKLGKRVLMNDTDSIIYVYKPDEYNIPQGDIWGEWEVEDLDSKNGGIVEFVGLAPKTYALKTFNDKTLVKAKGLSLKLAHQKLVNFNVFRELVKEYLDNDDIKIVAVPQAGFRHNHGEGIRNYKTLKKLCLCPDELKGELRGPYLFPFGHE